MDITEITKLSYDQLIEEISSKAGSIIDDTITDYLEDDHYVSDSDIDEMIKEEVQNWEYLLIKE